MAFSLQPSSASTTSQSCLCHKSGAQGPLTNFSSLSWNTFKNACDLRQDDISQSMEGKWESGPFGGYHRKCYQNYTAKSHVERVVAKRRRVEPDNSSSAETEQERDTPVTRSSLPSTIVKKCWICQSEKTDIKDRRRKEKLTSCQTMKAGSTLLEAAKSRDDQRLVVALNDHDPVAIEVCYHKSCYRSYTNLKKTEISRSEDGERDLEESQQYEAAFQELKIEIEQQLFQKFEVLHMSDLRERYVEKLFVQGIQNPLYRTEKLKARILKAYSDRVKFWHPRYRCETELIYCNDVPKGQIVESAVKVSNEENTNAVEDNNTYDNCVYYAAKNVRSSLLNYETIQPWPPYSTDLKDEHISLPSCVNNFFAWILTDDNDSQPQYASDEKVDLKDSSVKRLVQSFGQDLLYAVSKGRQKTPKHVAIPLTVKNLTGSKEVIKLLNRYGHGISYDQVLQIETSLAEEQMKTEVNGVLIPKIIQPNVFSTFCWDNIDLLEETLSGQGTTHCTNGIVIQRQVAGCEPPPIEMRNPCGVRARSFHASLNQVYNFEILHKCM